MSLPSRSPHFFAPSVAHSRVRFGAPGAELDPAGTLHVALPVLGGPVEETLHDEAAPVPSGEGFALFRARDGLSGFAVAADELELEAAAADLYRRLFVVTAGLHLHRIWNYVPAINAVVDGLENYRRFCRGRSLAFETQFGQQFQYRLPAASGVGADRGPLALAFLAGERAPRHFENPHQVPAFRYPTQYGPRPPSFSRATLVGEAGERQQFFISGTAAIRGHATIAEGDLEGQLACTLENLRTISETAGKGTDLAAGKSHRTFKVYLRHATDLAPARAYLEQHVLREADEACYLRADLCRADLLVEIEGVITS